MTRALGWLKPLLRTLLGNHVLGGPFKGMRYINSSSGSTFLPKILGTYEAEIAEDLISLVHMAQSAIVDVGCAEGYYANGALKLNPAIKVIGFDSNPVARQLCYNMAERNGFNSRLHIFGYCDHQTLNSVLVNGTVDLVIADIEGYETELLDPAAIPALCATNLIVETHSQAGEEVIISRFSSSHEIKRISPRSRSWRDIEIPIFRNLAHLSPQFERSCVWERPSHMQTPWLIMRVKSQGS